jgi:outer membrane usher protein
VALRTAIRTGNEFKSRAVVHSARTQAKVYTFVLLWASPAPAQVLAPFSQQATASANLTSLTLGAADAGAVPMFSKLARAALPIGGAISLMVPLKIGAQTATEINIKVTGNQHAWLPKERLIDVLRSQLTPASLVKLQALKDAGGFVSVPDVCAAGFNVIFDPGLLEMRFTPDADQRAVGDISFARAHPIGPDTTATAKPAIMSGFINIIGSAGHVWTDVNRQSGQGGTRFDIAAVARLWDVVIENEMTVQSLADQTRDLYGRPVYRFQQAGLTRSRTRATYDIPGEQIRLQAGDTEATAAGFQNSSNVLGISIEKTPRKLAPNQNIRPSGRSSFRIDRPAEIDVIINGVVAQHLRLQPGNYNISDLPLNGGGNDIELVITDDTGERRSLKYTTFFDDKLLAAGKNEWTLTGGTPAYLKDTQVSYLTEQWYATGFYRQGLSDAITGEANIQADNHTVMGGFGALLQTKAGSFAVQASASYHDVRRTDVAGSVNWDLVNFKGLTGSPESIRLGAEYRGANFMTAGELTMAAQTTAYNPVTSQVINPYRLRFSGTYNLQLSDKITAAFSARYQIAQSRDTLLLPQLADYQAFGNRYGADLTLSAPLSATTSMSWTGGYSNEANKWSGTTPNAVQGEFRTMLRLFVRPEQRATISASYDTLNRSASVSASKGSGSGVDRWDTSVSAQHDGLNDRGGASGAVNFTGNRFETSVSQSAAVDGAGMNGSGLRASDQRTNARIGTALVFADGKVGVSAPVRGNGFAIVTPHESLTGKEVILGSPDVLRGRSDWLGPAVVNDLPAYVPVAVPVDVSNLPVGYNLGAGAFDVVAPYKAGYSIKVGSAYSVSAYGTLLLTDGTPVTLQVGSASPEKDTQKIVPIFTNSAGRFGAEGLAPGRWIIEMATDAGPIRYRVDVPDGSQGLYKTGNLRPIKGT